MRFVFLGTGTSSGVPAIGCACRVCQSSDPRDNRLRTSAALRFTDPDAPHAGQQRTILIDAGPDLRQQALRAGLDRCDAIFFTHNHVDHTFGLDETRRFNVTQRTAISVYGSPHTLEFLERVFQHIFDRKKNINDSFVATLIAHRLAPAAPVDVHGLRFTPIPLLHGKLPVFGYRIEPAPGARLSAPFLPLAYCTDVSAIPTESWPLLAGVRTLVIDALRSRHHPTHLTLGQAVSIAHEVGAAKTYFIHMAHDLMHQETEDELPENMHLAYDGLELT